MGEGAEGFILAAGRLVEGWGVQPDSAIDSRSAMTRFVARRIGMMLMGCYGRGALSRVVPQAEWFCWSPAAQRSGLSGPDCRAVPGRRLPAHRCAPYRFRRRWHT